MSLSVTTKENPMFQAASERHRSRAAGVLAGRRDEPDGVGFFRGLFVALVLSLIGYAMVALVLLAALRLAR
jgi:hypothetical protein